MLPGILQLHHAVVMEIGQDAGLGTDLALFPKQGSCEQRETDAAPPLESGTGSPGGGFETMRAIGRSQGLELEKLK